MAREPQQPQSDAAVNKLTCSEFTPATPRAYLSNGLIGLQPAILAAMADRFGADAVRCLDRNAATCGTARHGVTIEKSTDESVASVCAFADLVLCTGSTVVNHTLPGIAAIAAVCDTPIIYYGTTIAGTAELLGLERRCPMAA